MVPPIIHCDTHTYTHVDNKPGCDFRWWKHNHHLTVDLDFSNDLRQRFSIIVVKQTLKDTHQTPDTPHVEVSVHIFLGSLESPVLYILYVGWFLKYIHLNYRNMTLDYEKFLNITNCREPGLYLKQAYIKDMPFFSNFYCFIHAFLSYFSKKSPCHLYFVVSLQSVTLNLSCTAFSWLKGHNPPPPLSRKLKV